MAEMAVQGLLEFWPCKNVNKLISGCLYYKDFFISFCWCEMNFIRSRHLGVKLYLIWQFLERGQTVKPTCHTAIIWMLHVHLFRFVFISCIRMFLGQFMLSFLFMWTLVIRKDNIFPVCFEKEFISESLPLH